MICQAIVASHEPKQSTVIRIKQYIMDYHPDFNIESRPHKFKTAMERALKNGVIRYVFLFTFVTEIEIKKCEIKKDNRITVGILKRLEKERWTSLRSKEKKRWTMPWSKEK